MKTIHPFLILALVFAFPAHAHESHEEEEESTALFFDKPSAKTMEFRFEIEEVLYPEKSPFKIQDFAFLSNKAGERSALVNLTNTAPAPRSLSPNQIYGLFADGTYRKPTNLSNRIDGGKTTSVLISFGISKTPLIKLIVRNF